jgi:hypothetical protein
MKPILIIRVPKDAVDSIPLIKEKSYRSFRQYKVRVVFDDDKQQGFKFSVINPTLKSDEIVEREILEQMPGIDYIQYTVKTKIRRFESNTIFGLIKKVAKYHFKNLFYYGKCVN